MVIWGRLEYMEILMLKMCLNPYWRMIKCPMVCLGKTNMKICCKLVFNCKTLIEWVRPLIGSLKIEGGKGLLRKIFAIDCFYFYFCCVQKEKIDKKNNTEEGSVWTNVESCNMTRIVTGMLCPLGKFKVIFFRDGITSWTKIWCSWHDCFK